VSGFGILPFGTVAPWGGPGLLSIITALCVGENKITVFFTDPPKWRDPIGYRDSRNALNWRVDPIDPAVPTLDGGIYVEPGKRRPTRGVVINDILQDEDDPTQLHVWTAPTLEPGIEYAVQLVGPILGANCQKFGGQTIFIVTARDRPLRNRTGIAAVDTYGDWSNPFFEIDPVTGLPVARERIWRYDEAGELVLADNAESLKTRILQRIQTEVGAFSHLPNYGLTSFAKRVARPYDVQQIAVRVREQIQFEPDVREAAVEARVEVEANGGGVVRFVISVQPRTEGLQTFLFDLPAR